MGLGVVTYTDQLQNLQMSACRLSSFAVIDFTASVGSITEVDRGSQSVRSGLTGLLRQGPASTFPGSFGVGGPQHPEHAHGRTRDARCTRATTRSGAERRDAPPLLQSGRNVEKVSPTLAPQQTYTVVERASL
ncbi:hypothetical protein G5I_02029 [Acromyrmex echinatior]|uniref:Uncharacterized protein n=1 Tax=Acromyrmex echinatior TaxID=103372 RepID=F4W982_ACREC|nr:hypothetical protein G5I_02029 [Acromyrmex echinatior]